jgi:predicted HAD superfamily phosphohydrolase
MAIVGKWLGKVFKLIENREENTDEGAKKAITRELRTAITDFYRNDIGITWDNQGRTISFHQTKLGETIAELYVVGDREKAAIVRRLVAQNLLHPAAPGVMFWGDGVNDTLALGDKNGADWRIAFDGDAAAKAANIGVIASDIGKPGIALVKAFKRHPQRRPTPEQIQTVVYEAQEEVGKGAAIIHVAGPNTPISLLHEHRAMKIFIRGERGAAIDHQHEVTT